MRRHLAFCGIVFAFAFALTCGAVSTVEVAQATGCPCCRWCPELQQNVCDARKENGVCQWVTLHCPPYCIITR